MRFADIPGHDEVKARLREMADSGHVPHALLLEGPEGTGKYALARAFIQYVNCENRRPGDNDSCGRCRSCVQHQMMQYVDTSYSFPVIKLKSKATVSDDLIRDFIDFTKESPFMDRDMWLEHLGNVNAQPRIYVEEAQEIIRRQSFASQTSAYKSVIMWQAERLQEETANKLLKIIEEPPGRSIFVMTSDNPLQLLPTIYSRVQRIKVPRLDDATVAQWMADTGLATPDKAASLAPIARGSLTRAARLAANSADTDRYLDMFIRLMRLAYQRDIASLKTWSAETAALGREALVDFLTYTATQLRENFVANLGHSELNLMTEKESAFSNNFSRFVNERNVVGLTDAVTAAINDVRGNANAKIVMFDFAITVILLLKN